MSCDASGRTHTKKRGKNIFYNLKKMRMKKLNQKMKELKVT